MKKKGQFGGMQQAVIALVGIAIVLAIGFLIIAETKSQIVEKQVGDICTNATVTQDFVFNSTSGICYNATSPSVRMTRPSYTHAYNASLETTEALAEVPGWLSILVIVLIGGIILGAVALFGRMRN